MSPRQAGLAPLRAVRVQHARRVVTPDAEFERGLAAHLRATMTPKAVVELWGRFAHGTSEFDALMRRAVLRALARRLGDGVRLEPGVGFLHAETFEIGDGVYVGAQAQLEGRSGGDCRIGARVWIGPHVYLDARDLVVEDDVGLGAGVRILGSAHTGVPAGVPVVETDLEPQPVRIEAGAEVGVNAVVMPGVTIGRGSMVGAGAVVTRDVPPMAVAVGVPAAVVRYRRTRRPKPAREAGP